MVLLSKHGSRCAVGSSYYDPWAGRNQDIQQRFDTGKDGWVRGASSFDDRWGCWRKSADYSEILQL